MSLVAGLLMASGVFFLLTGTIGYIRMPDFFTRMHAISKPDTLGALLSTLGLACLAGWTLVALKLLLVALFIFIANPVATHAIARAGLRAGLVPWTRGNHS